jgi:hypothetical protein
MNEGPRNGAAILGHPLEHHVPFAAQPPDQHDLAVASEGLADNLVDGGEILRRFRADGQVA